jgi:cbb3-type cytochrome oxidase maturation protein
LNILFLLIPLALVLLGVGIAAFFWATKSGQFDDLESPAWSVVMDDDRAPDSVNRRTADDSQDDSADQDS